MRLDQLDHGETYTVRLRPTGGKTLTKAPLRHAEVRLDFLGRGGVTMIRCEGQNLPIEGVDDVSERRLRSLRQLEPARLCWLVQYTSGSDGSELTVSVHRFSRRVQWDSELVLGIDERVVERVCAMDRRRLDVAGVCSWLENRVLLPAVGPDRHPRVVATGTPEMGGRFRLLGRGVAVDIKTQGERLLVDRVVALRRRQREIPPPQYLMEVGIQFVDQTAAGEVRRTVKAELARIVAEAASSYFALWNKYQVLEREQILSKARQVGWVEYTERKFMPSGLWRFTLTSMETFNRFLERLPNEEQDLEANSRPPNELLAGAKSGTSDEVGMRPFVGRLVGRRWDSHQLFIRPLDEDSDTTPPKAGCLFGALQGDRARLSRREEAVRQLSSADARMPQLALIIEGEPAPMRRADKDKALSDAARKHFAIEATPAQRDALDRALNTPDIALIQGPPGTGKTTVIAALLTRLAEIEAERPEIAGRTLLTSYQHDAVDNAVGRAEVHGLPPARFGGRRGERPFDGQADRWAANAVEQVEATLASLDDDRPRAEYEHFRNRLAVFASGYMPPEQVHLLLDELVELPAGVLATELWERLRALRGKRPAQGAEGLPRALAMKAARGIRTTDASFEDDGPIRARRALRELAGLIDEDEKALLDRAAAAEPGMPFAEVIALAPLRASLLDRLRPEVVPGDDRQRDPAVHQALNEAVAALWSRVEQSRGGVADALQEYTQGLRLTPGEVIRTLRHYSAVYAATCQQAVGKAVVAAIGAESTLEFENVVVDEAARANPLDLFIPLALAGRRVILVGDHRQLPHLLETAIERELGEGVDEATHRALKESLFERLFGDLKRREKSDGVTRVVTLDKQFRMHPVLGQFVSDVFYKPFGEGFKSPRRAEQFTHSLPAWSRGSKPVCAAWKSIPPEQGPERRAGTSWERQAEATWIASEVHRLLQGPAHDLSVGVISFYRAQVQAVLEAMQPLGLTERDHDRDDMVICPQWQTLERPDGKRVERLRVGTVDAFQGMEFDIVFLSAVRSNQIKASDEGKLRGKYGHLMLPNRLCVAMSRQIRLLVVVGDPEMFEDERAREAVPGLVAFLELCGGDDALVA